MHWSINSMRLPGSILALLLGITRAAVAGCESPTATLDAATVAFKCKEGVPAQDSRSSPSGANNVSIVAKQPEPQPEPEAVQSPVSAPGAQARPIGPPRPAESVRLPKPKHQAAKFSQLHQAKQKSPNSPRAKHSANKKSHIIHLGKPSASRRIMQFLGFR